MKGSSEFLSLESLEKTVIILNTSKSDYAFAIISILIRNRSIGIGYKK